MKGAGNLGHVQVMVLPGRQQGRQRAVASAIQHGLSYLCSLVLRRTASSSAGCILLSCNCILPEYHPQAVCVVMWVWCGP